MEMAFTPLCSAGHLPHKGGEQVASTIRKLAGRNILHPSVVQPISLLVGEMSGRTEGGTSSVIPGAISRSPFRET